MPEFYYNIETGQVEEGRLSDGLKLMGPYASREEASQALSRARDRNAHWDEEDRAWEDQDS